MDAKAPMSTSAAASVHGPRASATRQAAAPRPRKKINIITRRPQRSPRRRARGAPPAGAEEKDPHHPAPAPEIAETARRERAEAEEHESPRGVRHEVLPEHAPLARDRRDGGGEDQQEQVVERVADVQEQAGGAQSGHGPYSSPCRTCLTCYSLPTIVANRT